MNVQLRMVLGTMMTTLPADQRTLVLDYLPLARRLAIRFRGPGAEYEDLVQVASLALVKAAMRFDPTSGEFGVFANVTIVGELKRHLRDSSWAVRPPRGLQELGLEILKVSAGLAQTSGVVPGPVTLAQAMDIPVAKIREAIRSGMSRRAASLDQPIGSEGLPLSETLNEEGDSLQRIDERLALEQLCEDLTAADRQLLTLRFFDRLTQREIALVLGTTQMVISRRLIAVLASLRVRATRANAA